MKRTAHMTCFVFILLLVSLTSAHAENTLHYTPHFEYQIPVGWVSQSDEDGAYYYADGIGKIDDGYIFVAEYEEEIGILRGTKLSKFYNSVINGTLSNKQFSQTSSKSTEIDGHPARVTGLKLSLDGKEYQFYNYLLYKNNFLLYISFSNNNLEHHFLVERFANDLASKIRLRHDKIPELMEEKSDNLRYEEQLEADMKVGAALAGLEHAQKEAKRIDQKWKDIDEKASARRTDDWNEKSFSRGSYTVGIDLDEGEYEIWSELEIDLITLYENSRPVEERLLNSAELAHRVELRNGQELNIVLGDVVIKKVANSDAE